MDILFWSGGKDAYLALQFYRQDYPDNDRELRLLTTYEEETEVVPHQQIPLSHIRRQAASLELDLIRVPLPSACPNKKYLAEVNRALEAQSVPVGHLIFGDWHLRDIRRWREEAFGEMGYDCLFPIWEKSIHELLPVLQLNPVDVTISAVREEYQSFIRVGELFDQSFVVQLQHLPEEIDPMGEQGEFHTKVTFPELKEENT